MPIERLFSYAIMTNIVRNNWHYNGEDNIFEKCITLKTHNLKNYESYYE